MENIIFSKYLIECLMNNNLLNYSKVLLLTDKNVKEIYHEQIDILQSSFKCKMRIFSTEPGEKAKSIETVMEILRFLINNNFQRDSLIINFGGGVITDLGGFIASNYLRGIDYVNIPTTIISQIDAAIGGKTAINTYGFKNNFGSFYKAKHVVINPDHIKTLPEEEYINGYGEILKYQVLIGDRMLLEREYEDIVKICLDYKISLVNQDSYDMGVRQLLNLGHTVGHGLEALLGIPHGVSVAYGILVAADIGLNNYSSSKNFYNELLSNFATLDFCYFDKIKSLDLKKLSNIVSHDKKIKEGKIKWILPLNWGKIIREEVNEELWQQSLQRLVRGDIIV